MKCPNCESYNITSFRHIGSKVWCTDCGFTIRPEGGYEPNLYVGFSKQEVINYLKKYQSWRRGENPKSMEEAGIDPKELGIMLDRAIKLLEHL